MQAEKPDQHGIEAIEAACRRAATGEHDALEHVLTAYHRRLLGFVRRKIDARWLGKIEPEDVLQEAYVEAFKSIGGFQYQGEESLYHWMTRIIDNRFFSQVRRWQALKRQASRETRKPDCSSAYQTLLEELGTETQTPSRVAHQLEVQGAIMSCMARLPDELRIVVYRHYFQADTFAAIARDLNRSEDSIRRMAQRAMDGLKTCMGRASQFLSGVR